MLLINKLEKIKNILCILLLAISILGGLVSIVVTLIGGYFLPKPFYYDELVNSSIEILTFISFLLSGLAIYAILYYHDALLAHFLSYLGFLFIQLVICLPYYLMGIFQSLDSIWERLYRQSKETINSIERTFQCCGFNDVSDRAVPTYCYYSLKFKSSCATILNDYIETHSEKIKVVASYILYYQLLVIVLSGMICLLRSYIKKVTLSQNLSARRFVFNSNTIRSSHRDSSTTSHRIESPERPLVKHETDADIPSSYNSIQNS